MVVQVTNITDGPGKSAAQVDIYNKTLDPGATIRLPAELINEKVRKLEKAGLIAIGQLPSWYTAAKNRKGRALSAEEIQKRIHKQAVPKPADPAPISIMSSLRSPGSSSTQPQPQAIKADSSVEVAFEETPDPVLIGDRRRKR